MKDDKYQSPFNNVVGADRLIEAAKEVIASASGTYKKRNGHLASFEDDSGEKCWIVPFDAFEGLRSALTATADTQNPLSSINGEIGETSQAPAEHVVGVKPLEWKQTQDGRFASGLRPNHFSAENYRIHLITRGWVIDDGRFTFLRKTFTSELEAKSAAQAHWEGRIRAAISASEVSDNGN